ncbi:MAG: RHS repeat-associated core domain-containing protein, partial [Cruoricaptor ignavus]|nr:RHS repeat-associated core domain-containing protein [Cruoricaptor ignavus]
GFAPLGGQGDRRYTYDGNGNPTGYEEFKSFRMMVWDEENRLRGINDNGLLHLYTYDHTGERTLKSSSETSQTMINGATAAIITHNEDYTAYVSPYFVVQKGRFTKHYFEGASRISSKLGEGTFTQNGKGITAGGIDYLKQTALLDEALRNYIKNLNTPPGPPTQQGIYASPEWTGQPYPSIDWEAITQNQEPPEGWPRPPKFNEPGDVPGPPVQYGDPITPENVEAGFNFVDNGIEEKNIYYYHPDHLGSSSHITDINGNLSQHTEFMAFGEVLFDEHSTSITQPYLFNGKELDSETNLTYYGARYLDMKTSLWLNVDPLVERTLQPYQYANNNPVMFIDPDGRCYTRADNGDYIPCAPPIKDVTFATKLESSKPIITYNYGVNQTDAFGNDWTFTKNDAWELVNANSHPNYSQKVTIAPTGDASYYEQRYTAHIETYGTTPPDYYLSYGHKYANKFTKELRGELSDAGKKWIDQTVNELQVQMNTFIDGNPSIQGNNDTFRTKAFDTHVPAYTKDNLLKNLPFKDKVKIGLTPDFRDLTSPDGMKQVRQIIPKIF